MTRSLSPSKGPRQIVLATHNPHKVEEFQAIVETNCAVRCGSEMSEIWSSSRFRFAAASFAWPAQ